MRRGLSKTFRSTLVEFDTDLGLRYAAPPTFWVRMYLIWTFRNFRSLPKQVFNRHQQKLIDELILSSTVSPRTRVDRSSLIGTVEQVRLKSSGPAQRAADREATVAESDLTDNSPHLIVRAKASQQGLGNPANPPIMRPLKSSSTVSTRRDMETASLLLMGAAVLIAAVFIGHRIRIHGREDHVRTGPTALSTPVSNEPQIRNIALPVPTTPPTEQLSHSANNGQVLPAHELTVPSNAGGGPHSSAPDSMSSSNPKEGRISLAAILAPTEPRMAEPTRSLKPETLDLDSALPRLAGPPQSRMIYPTYPETQQNGKVVLTAVIAPDGTVKSVSVISGKKVFASAALKAVRQWHYLPYELQGKAVEFQTTIAFDFRGDEVISVSFPQL